MRVSLGAKVPKKTAYGRPFQDHSPRPPPAITAAAIASVDLQKKMMHYLLRCEPRCRQIDRPVDPWFEQTESFVFWDKT
jgi:hypothetical protein